MLFEKLKEKYTQVRFDPHEQVYKSLLSTILGDLQKLEKDKGSVTDEQVIALLKKYRENAVLNASFGVPTAKEEIHILDGILPKQMSNDEIESSIRDIITSLNKPNLGFVMSQMKAQYAGLYDAKYASNFAKELLS